MIIEFVFHNIKDKSKLYKIEQYEQISRFTGEPEIVENIQYVGGDYCNAAINMAVQKISGIKTCEYKGATERIANETFIITTDSTTYTVTCTVDTYRGNKAGLYIKIVSATLQQEGIAPVEVDSDSTNAPVASVEYDYLLEKLKIEIKKAFREDWNSCVWVRDEQSESLCSVLYPCIFRAENRIRAFASKVLIWELGTNWIASPGLEKYADSHKSLCVEFRRKEPSFADVDDVFISATLETLFEIVKKGVIYETPFELSKEQCNELLNLVTKGKKDNSIVEWLNRKRKVRLNLWTNIFEQYFAETNNAQEIITDFIKNRNHIAHNKPITFGAYQKMAKSFEDFDNMIIKANTKFDADSPSEEYDLTIDLLNEQAQQAAEEAEYERNYLRERIRGETGVEILWRDDIFEMLTEKAELLYQTFRDLFYWDSRFEFSTMQAIEDNETWQTLFSVECKANEEYYIEVQVAITIDDEMDGDSSLNYRYIIHGLNGEIIHSNNGHATASVRYHNGSGNENVFEGTIEILSDSDMDESEMDDFLEELKTAIETFNPYIAIKAAMERAAVKDGEPQPVADFPCWECEQYGVSLREDLYKFGHCCYCGSDNEVQICEVCSTPFGDGEGSEGICNNCLAKIEQE